MVAGDILVSTANSWNLVGKCVWVPVLENRSCFGGFVSVLRGREEKIRRKYLYWWFSSPRVQRVLQSFGNKTTSISNLNIERCLSLEVPLPDLAEQDRVVELLDRVDALLRLRKKTISELSLMKEALLHELLNESNNCLSWAEKNLGDVSVVQGGLQVSAARKKHKTEFPYLRVANVYRGQLCLDEVKEMGVSEKELGRTLLKANDILVVEGHGNPNEVGRCALWDGSINPVTHQNHLIRVRLDERMVLPRFACDYMNSPVGRRHLLGAGKTTSGLNTISTTDVRSVPLKIPPLAVQHDYVSRVQAVDAISVRNAEHLNELGVLFSSLQHRAFRGEL